MESLPISTEFEPLGSGPDISDAVTHNRTVVRTMLRSPEAYSPSRWVEADNFIDKQLSTGTLLRIKYKYSRVEDVELKEDIATALRSMTPHQTQDSLCIVYDPARKHLPLPLLHCRVLAGFDIWRKDKYLRLSQRQQQIPLWPIQEAFYIHFTWCGSLILLDANIAPRDAQHFRIKTRWRGRTENGACPACKIVWNSNTTNERKAISTILETPLTSLVLHVLDDEMTNSLWASAIVSAYLFSTSTLVSAAPFTSPSPTLADLNAARVAEQAAINRETAAVAESKDLRS
ncbi:unnamed protein product [Aureobasidium pullulans]|nr:unnamed protein product [Aureobasidium pullulans]